MQSTVKSEEITALLPFHVSSCVYIRKLSINVGLCVCAAVIFGVGLGLKDGDVKAFEFFMSI